MKLKDLLTLSTYNAIGDMDVSNDCIDECAHAWCGNTLTEEGERQFAAALDLDAELGRVWGEPGIVVKIDHLDNYEEAWDWVQDLFSCMAGYCSEEDYDKWFDDNVEV